MGRMVRPTRSAIHRLPAQRRRHFPEAPLRPPKFSRVEQAKKPRAIQGTSFRSIGAITPFSRCASARNLSFVPRGRQFRVEFGVRGFRFSCCQR